ncbi:MAG: endolytic transglycosylase MltG [Patescibacteria group bacterium]
MKLLASIFAALALISLLSFTWWIRQLSPLNPASDQTRTFIITPAQSASAVSQALFEQKFIRSVQVAKIYFVLSGLDKKIKAGTYLLSPATDLKNLLTSLTSGPRDIWVTFPEGWRREQIAARLASNLDNFDSTGFLSLTATLEGRLFPDTYLIPAYSTPADIADTMTATFNRKVGPIDSGTLILASLIERETRAAADRPVVAGILLKRIKAGWPLQVDATIQYARGDWSPVTDTRYPSIYNTYIHIGLPPTPIANPGLASIEAVRRSQNSPYWFYLHAPDGTIHYATTVEEHNLNIDKYLTR